MDPSEKLSDLLEELPKEARTVYLQQSQMIQSLLAEVKTQKEVIIKLNAGINTLKAELLVHEGAKYLPVVLLRLLRNCVFVFCGSNLPTLMR